MPGDFLQAAKAEELARASAELKDYASRFLALPTIGYTRELQEYHQRLARLNVECLEALQAYNVSFGRVAARSLETFRKAIDQTA